MVSSTGQIWRDNHFLLMYIFFLLLVPLDSGALKILFSKFLYLFRNLILNPLYSHKNHLPQTLIVLHYFQIPVNRMIKWILNEINCQHSLTLSENWENLTSAGKTFGHRPSTFKFYHIIYSRNIVMKDLNVCIGTG